MEKKIKKLTRKQKFEEERDFLLFRFILDMQDLLDKYYPKGGFPTKSLDWELLKKHYEI